MATEYLNLLPKDARKSLNKVRIKNFIVFVKVALCSLYNNENSFSQCSSCSWCLHPLSCLLAWLKLLLSKTLSHGRLTEI